MSQEITLWDLVDSIGAELGTDWKNVPPDQPHQDSEAYRFSAECWLHVLRGLRNGQLLAFNASEKGPAIIKPQAWPDVSVLQDPEPQIFTILADQPKFKIDYSKPEALYAEKRKGRVSDQLLIDSDTAAWFKALFKDSKYQGSQSRKWRNVGNLGEMPAVLLGDLLEAWAESDGIDPLPMRKSLLKALKHSNQDLAQIRTWATPHGVFNSEGTPVSATDIANMEMWVAPVDDMLEFEWTDEWVVGREWLRKFCTEDPTNRPFPAFWERPTPLPAVLIELKNRPSPLKGRVRADITERNTAWLKTAKVMRKRHSQASKADICRFVANDRGLNEKPETILRTLNRQFPTWDK